MTPEKQRIAIAEACGWKIEGQNVKAPDGSVWGAFAGGAPRTMEFLCDRNILPDCLTDLNAMHEAEELLNQDEPYIKPPPLWFAYEQWLLRLNKAPANQRERYRRATIHATASQRAEAFLRTLNLWTDE